jgi:hypothetical protein
MGGSGTALLGPLPLAGGLPPNAAFASSSANRRRSVSCARAGAPSGLPSSPEKPAQQLENAKDDASFFAGIRDMHQGTVDEHKSLATTVADAIRHGEANVADADRVARAAQERAERIERREAVPSARDCECRRAAYPALRDNAVAKSGESLVQYLPEDYALADRWRCFDRAQAGDVFVHDLTVDATRFDEAQWKVLGASAESDKHCSGEFASGL